MGKATPYLVHAFPVAGPAPVLLAASVCAIAAAVMVGVLFRDGPFRFPPRQFSWTLVSSVIHIREWRLSTASYLGHMFELYAFWAWIPAFLASSARGVSPASVSLLSFGTIAVGGAGSVWGGLFADRRGRERLVTMSLVASGTCCLLSALVFDAPLPLVVALTFVWGFFVIADSAQFSTLVTESVPPHAVGTALTLQTSLGFLLTMLPMQIVPMIARQAGWRWAFVVLALGPVAGVAAIRALRRVRIQAAASRA